MGNPNGFWEIVESFNRQSLTAKFSNGSYIYLRSCDRPDDLRGPNLSWFFIDEAAKTPHKVWRIMLARLRVKPEKGWITTTPRGRNWVWEEFARKKREDYEFYTGSTLENVHLSRDYTDSLLENYSGQFLAQEVYGEFVGWEGLVYNLELERHHRSRVDEEYKYAVAGVDWGWIDPTVIVVGLVGYDDSIHIVEEYYEKKRPIENIVEKAVELKEKWNIRTFYCDYARPEYIQELRNAGLDSRKGKKELDPGIATVNNYLDKGLLTLDFNECPHTVDEFQTYHYEEDDLGVILKDRPVDKDNHACDAVRYMVYSHSKKGYVGSQRGNR
jgi:PBSX family phage terminase large subunit